MFRYYVQAMTFNQVIQTGPDEEGSDDKAVTAMGILNTIDTLLSVVEDHKEVSKNYSKADMYGLRHCKSFIVAMFLALLPEKLSFWPKRC